MLLGALQGIIFGVVILLSKKYRSKSIYFLIALILSVVYNNLQYYVTDIQWISMETIWLTVYLPIASLAPALIYFYVVTSLDAHRKILRHEKLLFVPFLVFFVSTLIMKIMGALDQITESSDLIFSAMLNLHEVVSFVFLFTILLVCLGKIFRFRKKLKKFDLAVIKPRLNWLIGILGMLLFISLWYGYYIYVMYSSPGEVTSYYAVWILNSFLIYLLGHIGIYKFGIQEERKKLRSYVQDNRNYSIVEKTSNEHITNLKEIVVDNKRYLDPILSLESVAEEVGLSKSHLSRTIHSELQTSFSDYVNSLRIDEAKKLLLNPDFAKYTLISIGLESGFNSKTTFNTAFKKFTGVTPSQFKKENR